MRVLECLVFHYTMYVKSNHALYIGCGLDCSVAGTSVNNDCSECVFDSICHWDNPCNNGGVCVPGSSSYEYTCECTDTKFTGDNCTGQPVVQIFTRQKLTFLYRKVCSLECSKGYVVSMATCTCQHGGDVCETDAPCLNNATCVPGSFPYQYECECGNHFGGENCTGKIYHNYIITTM